MREWQSTDPRHELSGRKWARIVILRPNPKGFGWEAGMGHVEMKHGWHVSTSFAEKPHVGGEDTWDPTWLWIEAPDR